MFKDTYILSSRCTLKFVNSSKKTELFQLLEEYNTLCQFYIDYLWNLHQQDISIPKQFRKEQYPIEDSAFSARLKCLCIQQASSIVRSQIEKNYDSKPIIEKKQICLDSKCSSISLNPNIKEFDLIVTLQSLGTKGHKLHIPLKKHKHFNSLLEKGNLLNGIIITEKHIQFNFEFEKKVKPINKSIGIDIGINRLFSCSDEQKIESNEIGKTYHYLLKEICNKKKNSKAYLRKVKEKNNLINYCVKQIDLSDYSVLYREDIKMLRYKKRNTELKSHFNYSYIFEKIEDYCNKQNVSVIKINQSYTSQRCFECGFVHKNNRKNDIFSCLQCGHRTDADINASKNVNMVKDLCRIPESFYKEKPNRTIGFFWHRECVECLESSTTRN